MRPKTVGALSALGMFLTSLTVFSLTPDGGFGAPATSALDPPVTSSGAGGSTASSDGAHFLVEQTLRVEGRLGHPAMPRGDRGQTYVLLEIQGTSEEGVAARAADGHLAIVLDQSGSMRGSRLANAKSAALRAVNGLRDGDQVTVVTFDTQPRVVVPPTVLDAASRGRIATDVQRIGLGGDTCISCGVEAALSELRSTSRTRRMLVLSDGDANSGLRDADAFRQLGRRAATDGIEITTVGVSLAYNEVFLAAVAETANGRHYFVENDAGLTRVFEEEARFVSGTVASDAVVEIELAPGVELGRVFDRTFTRSGSRLRIPIGALSRGEQKTVLLEVSTRGMPASSTLPVATTRVRYRDAVTGQDAAADGTLAATVVDRADAASPLDGVVAARLQRAETATLLEEANSLFREGKVDVARQRLAQGRGALGSRAEAAKTAAPTARRQGVDEDFADQSQALAEAEEAFASPPSAAPSPAAGAPPPPPPRPSVGGKKAVESANAYRR